MGGKHPVEIAHIGKAAFKADVQYAPLGHFKQPACVLKAYLVEILLKGHAHAVLEKVGQILVFLRLFAIPITNKVIPLQKSRKNPALLVSNPLNFISHTLRLRQ